MGLGGGTSMVKPKEPPKPVNSCKMHIFWIFHFFLQQMPLDVPRDISQLSAGARELAEKYKVLTSEFHWIQRSYPFFRWDIKSYCQNLIWRTGRKQNLQSQRLRLFLKKKIVSTAAFFVFPIPFFNIFKTYLLASPWLFPYWQVTPAQISAKAQQMVEMVKASQVSPFSFYAIAHKFKHGKKYVPSYPRAP